MVATYQPNTFAAFMARQSVRFAFDVLFVIVSSVGVYKSRKLNAADPKLPNIIKTVALLCLGASGLRLSSELAVYINGVASGQLHQLSRFLVSTASFVAIYSTIIFSVVGYSTSFESALNQYSNRAIYMVSAIGPALRWIESVVAVAYLGFVDGDAVNDGNPIFVVLNSMDILLASYYIVLYCYIARCAFLFYRRKEDLFAIARASNLRKEAKKLSKYVMMMNFIWYMFIALFFTLIFSFVKLVVGVLTVEGTQSDVNLSNEFNAYSTAIT
ncbi:hypothetical protein HDU91_002410, partial [Kappamyces sp. JEL0680]